MRTPIEILASLAILANAVIYGTDVFGAIVLRPAIAAVDDRTLTQLLGQIHRIADRRFPAIGAAGLIAANSSTRDAFPGHLQPSEQAREHGAHAAALADRVPGDARQLQARGTQHQRGRRAADPRPRRARRGLTASRRLSGWEPAALITTRNRPICPKEGTNEQPGS